MSTQCSVSVCCLKSIALVYSNMTSFQYIPICYTLSVMGDSGDKITQTIDAYSSVLMVLPRAPDTDEKQYTEFLEQARQHSYASPINAPKLDLTKLNQVSKTVFSFVGSELKTTRVFYLVKRLN